MTDGEYVQALTRLAGGRDIERVLVDPSAASFLEALRRAGWPAAKSGQSGVGRHPGYRPGPEGRASGGVPHLPGGGQRVWLVLLGRRCRRDRVRKEHDHAMDDIRYFVMGLRERGGRGSRCIHREANISRRCVQGLHSAGRRECAVHSERSGEWHRANLVRPSI